MDKKEYFSQYGEDRALDKIFQKSSGFCIEVGGYDGVTGSNTYYFERLGWDCLVLEPMPDFCKKIREARFCRVIEVAASNKDGVASFFVADGVETLSTMDGSKNHFERIKTSGGGLSEITVQTRKLANILDELLVREIDFITIDVEGHELEVLEGMELERISPRIIIVEDNSYGLDNALCSYLKSKSYRRFKKTGCNFWFVKNEDPLATIKNRASVEFDVFSFWLRQKIKPIVPSILRR